MKLTDQTQVKVNDSDLETVLIEMRKNTKKDFSDRTVLPALSELFLDKCPLTVTSEGRKPISGMNLGDYIPEFIDIDGKQYPHPSGGGRFAFFEDWENISWREVSGWSLSNTTISKEGSWLKLTATSANGNGRPNPISEGASDLLTVRVLLKKGNADTVFFGPSGTSSSNAKYTWSTDSFIDGSITNAVSSYRISDELVILIATHGPSSGTRSAYIALETSGDFIYISDFFAYNDISFIPPFGQDGNPKNPARAYNFDKWDHPISFKFQPQFGWDVVDSKYIISDHDSSDSITEFWYGANSDVVAFRVDDIIYILGYDGTNWDGGTTDSEDATPFDASTDDFLKSKHEILFFIDKANDLVNLWLDGDHVMNDVFQDLSSWEIKPVLSLGGRPTRLESDTDFFNGYISNFAVHDKTTSLPIDQTLDFYDPTREYGLDDSRVSDIFGNEAFRSVSGILGGAGSIVEEGKNINGSWVRFESGLLIQYYKSTVDHLSWGWPLPTAYKSVDYIILTTAQESTSQYVSGYNQSLSGFSTKSSVFGLLFWVTLGF